MQQKDTKALIDMVIDRVEQLERSGQIDLPVHYNAANALRGAWLFIQGMTEKDGTQTLTKVTAGSVNQALNQMVMEGLSCIKGHGVFVRYGNTLKWQREYFGDMALARRLGYVNDVKGNVIYAGDVFEWSINPTGKKVLVKHEQSLANIDQSKIVGAYAIVTRVYDTHPFMEMEVMTIDQIRKAWSMAKGGLTRAHIDFPDQMAIKTVIRRALKLIVNTSIDEDEERQEMDVEQTVEIVE